MFHWNADAVCYRLGGRQTGTSSHDCDQWIAEVNRIAPLIGLPSHAARNLPTRVRQSDGRTKVQRVCARTCRSTPCRDSRMRSGGNSASRMRITARSVTLNRA